MAFHEKQAPEGAGVAEKALAWVDSRFPVTSTWKAHLSEYYAPKNFNWWYIFGSLALLVLVIQIVTGIFLVMNYKPDAAKAFDSVEFIMREVPWGWLVRYMHSTGASAFFVVVYLHMFRGLIYGSYRKPRELVWIFGCAIFLCLMAEAFMGYLLPWGQMSYWGAQVIVNLFSAIPLIGPDLSLWIRGDFVVGDATLNRFFSFHVIAVPLVLLGLVVAHIIALHEVGSNNPDGVEIKEKLDAKGIPLDGVPFHPYYSVHDVFGVGIFLMIFSAVVFFAPEMGGYFLEANNFIPANSLKTPPHIAPVWYFTPFYSMLRATTSSFMPVIWAFIFEVVYFTFFSRPQDAQKNKNIIKAITVGLLLILIGAKFNVYAWYLGAAITAAVIGMQLFNMFTKGYDQKLLMKAAGLLAVLALVFFAIDAKFWGVVVMGGTVVIMFFLPWLDKSPVKSIRYRPGFHKTIIGIFVFFFILLGWLGMEPPSPIYEIVSQIGTLAYLGFFLLMPIWSQLGEFKPVPDRVNFVAH